MKVCSPCIWLYFFCLVCVRFLDDPFKWYLYRNFCVETQKLETTIRIQTRKFWPWSRVYRPNRLLDFSSSTLNTFYNLQIIQTGQLNWRANLWLISNEKKKSPSTDVMNGNCWKRENNVEKERQRANEWTFETECLHCVRRTCAVGATSAISLFSLFWKRNFRSACLRIIHFFTLCALQNPTLVFSLRRKRSLRISRYTLFPFLSFAIHSAIAKYQILNVWYDLPQNCTICLSHWIVDIYYLHSMQLHNNYEAEAYCSLTSKEKLK